MQYEVLLQMQRRARTEDIQDGDVLLLGHDAYPANADTTAGGLTHPLGWDGGYASANNVRAEGRDTV